MIENDKTLNKKTHVKTIHLTNHPKHKLIAWPAVDSMPENISANYEDYATQIRIAFLFNY